MISFLRIIRFALQDMVRNLSLSFMTLLILILMLLSINTLIIVRVFTDQTIETVKQQIDVSVYFHHEAKDDSIEEMRQYITAFPEVTDVSYYNKEQVLEQFRETHKDNPDIIASLSELADNPLGATMIIKTRDPADYKKVIDALNVPEYDGIIEAKTFADTEQAISRVTLITKQVEQAVYALTALFAIIAFFVIFNTVRVAIYTQRTEISIKKLVGATDWFVRGPYIVESVLFTILSVAITTGIMFFVIRFLDPYVSVLLNKEAFLTNYVESHILVLIATQCIVVFFLTIATSGLAMRKYLRT